MYTHSNYAINVYTHNIDLITLKKKNFLTQAASTHKDHFLDKGLWE